MAIPNIYRRGRMLTVFIHLIVICIIFFLPEILQQYGRPHRTGWWMWWPYIKAFVFVGVFYANYVFIIDRTLFSRRRHIFTFFGCNVLLVALVFLINYAMQRYWMMHATHIPPWRKELPPLVLMMREWSVYLRDLGMVVLTVALAVAMKFMEKWSAMETKNREMRERQRAAELENLKTQLNPHFLFNTLNTIYSLIEISPDEARDAVHKLSKLLRYMLYENPGEVRLSQELDFARTYISLMEMRIGQGRVITHFDGASEHDFMVAPLLCFTLVENAIKHGNTGRTDEPIEISVTTTPDGTLVCGTRNHFVAAKTDDKRHSGIGLANLRRRLALLYGDRATLESKADDDIYTATITIKSLN